MTLPKSWNDQPVYPDIKSAKADLDWSVEHTCGHCGASSRYYKRKLSGSIIWALGRLYRQQVYVRPAVKWYPSRMWCYDRAGRRIAGGPHVYLKLWKLIKVHDEETKYRLTDTARQWIEQPNIVLPQHAVELRQRVFGYIAPWVGFRTALAENEPFDINDIQLGNGAWADPNYAEYRDHLE